MSWEDGAPQGRSPEMQDQAEGEVGAAACEQAEGEAVPPAAEKAAVEARGESGLVMDWLIMRIRPI
ncbi:MAG: hypothetical protein JWP91_3378 [Fibrobacteres bacterium]|nr:hypothetical protein [Fibrobacterota bacterium]